VSEVAVYFEYSLFRGNRTVKVHAERFEAFRSPNWPVLAEAGVHIRYDHSALLPHRHGPLHVHQEMNDQVGVIRLFPGIRSAWVEHALAAPGLRSVVLTTFGSGNGPTTADFLNALRSAIARGVVIVNATQCVGGQVEQGRYSTSAAFVDMGMLSAANMTVEAALTKLMFLQARYANPELAIRFMQPICGEVG
jgi:L-asparaginase